MVIDEFRSAPMQDLKGYIAPSDVRKIIQAPQIKRDRLLLEILWVTGARVSEIVDRRYGLRPSDIALREKALILRTLKRGTKKNPKPPPPRMVVIPRRVLHDLVNYSKYIPPNKRIFPISRQWVFEIVRRAGRTAGVEMIGSKRVHPHHFRHSHCVAYVKHDNTMEGLRKLQQRLNHASISTTAHYLQFSTEGTAKKIEEIFG